MALVPEPVVVFYKSVSCSHCRNLTNIWPEVTTALKSVYPNLRFFVLTANDNSGKFDENIAPKNMIKFAKWFPMVILIPGKVWDLAMSNLGPKNNIEIKEGVQIMNAIWDKDEIKYSQKYDLRKPAAFKQWIKDSLDNEEFKRVQENGPSGPSGLVVPTTPSSSAPIQPPFLSNFVRPSNTNNNFVQTGNLSRNPPNDSAGDICSMRIISRRR